MTPFITKDLPADKHNHYQNQLASLGTKIIVGLLLMQ